MNLLTQSKKTTILPLLMAVALACFGLSPDARANPGEDRGNGNSAAEHVDALNLGTTGLNNTAHGWFSLFSNIAGSDNTADGFQALYNNTNGSDNTAVGFNALLNNDSTNSGTAINNTAVGSGALQDNVNGASNTAVGSGALHDNHAAFRNTAVGAFALNNNDSTNKAFGSLNTAVGSFALYTNTDGVDNTAVGDAALGQNTIGTENTAVGVSALLFNQTGSGNVAVGDDALLGNVGADNNVAVGIFAAVNATGGANTAVGTAAGGGFGGITSGADNVVLGAFAGEHIGAGSENIYLGTSVDPGSTESGTIRIGDSNVQAVGTTSKVFFAGIRGATVGAPALDVEIGPNNQLGVAPSSARYKKDIESMGESSEAIFGLRPVTFHYKGDTYNMPCFGLIAEEVAKVNPALIALDKEGKPYTVRYKEINAMLLNEFLKEHRKVEDLQATVAKQQEQINALTAGLQKVSAQLEMSKAAPQTVLNGH